MRKCLNKIKKKKTRDELESILYCKHKTNNNKNHKTKQIQPKCQTNAANNDVQLTRAKMQFRADKNLLIFEKFYCIHSGEYVILFFPF